MCARACVCVCVERQGEGGNEERGHVYRENSDGDEVAEIHGQCARGAFCVIICSMQNLKASLYMYRRAGVDIISKRGTKTGTYVAQKINRENRLPRNCTENAGSATT